MKYQLHECIGNRLRRLSRIVDGHYRKHIALHNLTTSQMSILFVLYETGAIQQSKLGELLTLERSTVSRNVRILKKREWLSSSDDYHPELTLSAKGNEKVSLLIPIWERIMDELYEKVGEEGIELLEKLENKLR